MHQESIWLANIVLFYCFQNNCLVFFLNIENCLVDNTSTKFQYTVSLWQTDVISWMLIYMRISSTSWVLPCSPSGVSSEGKFRCISFGGGCFLLPSLIRIFFFFCLRNWWLLRLIRFYVSLLVFFFNFLILFIVKKKIYESFFKNMYI